MNNEVIIAAIGMTALLVLVFILLVRSRSVRPARPLDPDTYIVVDGSNVMHWGGDPSVLVLSRVLGALGDKGLTPIVYFDANVGYKLWGRYTDDYATAKRLHIDARRVIVAPKGVTADELLLKTATGNGLRVVSNDRFRDWSDMFPRLREKGFLVKGEWRQGSVMLLGL